MECEGYVNFCRRVLTSCPVRDIIIWYILESRETTLLQLTDIVKTYQTGDTSVQALRGISIAFRRNEFVSILGPSGCG